MKKIFYILFLCIATGFSETVPLIALHQNDENGIYHNEQYPLGSAVTVSGIATVSSGVFSSTYLDAYIQDETSGIMLYSPNMFTFEKGDSLLVTGTLKQYRGTTEIEVISLDILKTGAGLPEPKVLSCGEIARAFLNDYTEPDEGRLIRLENATLTGTWPGSVNLQDSSGTCLLYIDTDTKLDEMNLSPGEYTVTGILKQYDRNQPYTEGYEIIPRYPEDILSDYPLLEGEPEVINITVNSFDARFSFNRESTGIIKIAPLDNPNERTYTSNIPQITHQFSFENLEPGTIYRLTPGTQYDSNQIFYEEFYAVARSVDQGQISVYFNQSADTTLAKYSKANSGINLEDKIIERINNCNYSIDLSIYSFSRQSIADALIDAKNRGVSVRIIYDNRTEQSPVTDLKNNGIPVITNNYGNNDGIGIMHNKIMVFDYRDTTSASDDWVITGSANFTYYGLFTNAQNMVFIRDKSLAAVYTREFEEMWGSSLDEPSADSSRFGANKSDNTPHQIQVGPILTEQYMGPSDDLIGRICEKIETADHSIYFSILAFTHRDVEAAIKNQLQRNPDLIIRGLFDMDNDNKSIYLNMTGQGSQPWDIPQDVLTDQGEGYLHHKVMIIDAEKSDSDPLVITGSANWSYSVENQNNENTLIIHNYDIANQYLQEFAARYQEAGGSGQFTHIRNAKYYQPCLKVKVFPQPASETIDFDIQTTRPNLINLKIYNLSGQTMLHENFKKNKIQLQCSQFASGIYFYKIESNQDILTGKLLILK